MINWRTLGGNPVKALIRGLVATALTGAASLLPVVPAQSASAATIDSCPSGYFCVWRAGSGTGTLAKFTSNRSDLGSLDNKSDAFWNRTDSAVCLYEKPGYAGQVFGAGPDESQAAFGDLLGSSFRFVPTLRECDATPYGPWAAEKSPIAQGFGDMNGDGRADALSRDKAGRLWLVSGTSDGTLIGSRGWNSMTALVRHGSFDTGGTEDLVARDSSGKLWLYPGTGKGTLGARTLIGTGGWNGMRLITAVGDINGDGHVDLVAADSSGRLWLYPGTGKGTPGSRKLIGTRGWNGITALTGIGDLNGDGRNDLIARDSSGKLWFYPGTGKGAPGTRSLIGGGWNIVAQFLAVGDTTGDGVPDLETFGPDTYREPSSTVVPPGAGSVNENAMWVYPGNGHGAFRSHIDDYGQWWSLNGMF